MDFHSDKDFEGVTVTIPSDNECQRLRDEIFHLQLLLQYYNIKTPETPLLDELHDNLPG